MKGKMKQIVMPLLVLCMIASMFAVNVFIADAATPIDNCTRIVESYDLETAKDYIDDGKTYTYPTCKTEGYLFAGWYTKETCGEDSYWGKETPGETVYALFIPSHVLDVKAQISGNMLDEDKNNDDTASIRFVTTVDSKFYKKVGFDVSYTLGDKKTTVTKVSNKVYETLCAVGDSSASYKENGEVYTPQGSFCNLSTYFKACTVKGLSSSLFSMPFSVKPFWVTVDGSKVYGDTVIRTINDYFLDEEVWVSSEDANAADTEANGTEANPFKTLDYALGMVRNQGIVHVKDSYTADSEFVWTDHDKTATITGGTVDFSGVPTKTINAEEKTVLDINDSVIFEGTTLTFADGQHIYANGNSVEIASDVKWGDNDESDASVQIFGGAYNTTLNADTNLVLAKGNYTRVYGGNNKGTLNGNTNVTLSGTINSALATDESYKEHGDTYVAYGGGTNSSTLKGDTNLTIANDTVMFNYVFGGSESGAITGDCNVTYAGKAMSVYAGGKSSITGNTYVTMIGGWAQQVFGGCDRANVIGNTNVNIQAGTVQRRVYGGCYNNADNNILSLSWTTSYKVTGNTNVSISPNATFSLNYSEMDNSIYSLSRYKEVMADEWGAFIFNADSYTNTYKSKLGYNDSMYSSYFSSKSYHYLITTNGNNADDSYGTVLSANDHIRIEPKRGYSATVKVDGVVDYYTKTVAAYKLPPMTNEDEPKNIEVIFSDEFSEVDTTNCEARIGGAYYDTLEDAVNAAKALESEDTTIVTLLKNAEVESAMTISSDVTIQNEAGKSFTVYRGEGLAAANMFNVTSKGSLTIQGVGTTNSLIFDGRTEEKANANTGIDAAAGSSASMIKNSGTVNIINATVQYVKKNLENGDGGVISNVSGATLNVTDSLFDNNYTTRYGSVVYNVGSMTFENSTFTNNKSGGNGGVLCHNGGTSFAVNGCTFTGNSGNEGGVIWSNMHYTVDGCTFTENSSTSYGGVIINRSTAKITNSTFKSNEAGDAGGVINTIATTGLIIENCDFIENSATNGGAIRTNDADVTITITGCEFKENSVTGSGGALKMGSLATVTVTDTVFEGNQATTSGGAIYTQSTKMTTIEGCNFTTNSATYGGAICTPNTTSIEVTIDDECEFIKNSASNSGGAINFGNATTGTIVNTVFEGNEAPTAGAITVATGGKASFADCEFKDNKNTGSTYQGDDVRLGGATCVIEISGKFVGNVHNRNTSTVKIVGALTEGSAIELDWNTGSSFEAIQFVDAQGNANENAEEVEANQNYIQLGELTFNRELELKYEGTTGILQEWGPNYIATVNVTLYESLTEAVTAANAVASEDTTIVTLLKNAEAESTMTISSNVTIQNKAGSSVTVYRGEGLAAANMFNVTAEGSLTIQGVETANSLILDGRTEEEAEANTGRDAANGSSASMIESSGTVNLNHVTVQYVKKTSHDGGAIFASAGTLTINASTFEDNSAANGGAIYHDGTAETDSLTVTDSIFVKNVATADGGAILAKPIVTVIEGCNMTENTAGGTGGAISMYGSVTAGRITDTNINYNTANNAGGMTIGTGGKITLTDCDFSNNNGTNTNLAELQGTDIRLGGASSRVTLAGKVVGKIYSRNTSVINVVDALSEESDVELDWYPRTETTWEPAVTEKVIEFFETSGDELVANTDAEEVKSNQDCIRIGQRIANNNWVFAYDGTIGKLATRTEENVAEVDGTKYTTLADAVAAAAASSTQPGVVKLIAENPIMVDSPISIPAGKKVTITDNGTRQEIRRAVPTTVPTKFCLFDIGTTGTLNVISTSDDINNPRIIVSGASDVIRNTTKSTNGAWSLFQMGLKSTDSATAKLTISGGVKLVDNYSAYIGSVISNYYGGSGASFSEVTLDKVLVANNYTKLQGTIYMYRTQSGIKVTNSDFINNTAYEGGAMWLDAKQVEIDKCNFLYNTSTADGGALRTNGSLGRSSGYTATIKNSNFVRNTAATEGGAISLHLSGSGAGSILTVENLVFNSNSATTGNDVYLSNVTSTKNPSEMKVSGKFVGNICMGTGNKKQLQVIGALTSDSNMELDWQTPAALTDAVTFTDADIMAASKAYIKLGSKMTGYTIVEGTNALDLQAIE